MANLAFPFYSDVEVRQETDEERQLACNTLWLEYRGTGTTIDSNNISGVAKGLSKKRLEQFALYINLVKAIIDKENTSYINPPTRIFTTAKGTDVSVKLRSHLDKLFDDMNYDSYMQVFETNAALLGTVLVRPVVDSRTSKMHLIELTPANQSLRVTTDPLLNNKAMGVQYKPTESVTISVDYDKIITETVVNGQTQTVTEPHSFKDQLFAVLNFTLDPGTFWGPFDGTLYSFSRQRSLILANTCAAMHLTDAERLVISGMSWEEALKAVKDRMIVLPNDKTDENQQKIEQKAELLSPQGQDALNILEPYLKLYYHLLDVRMHSPKNFVRGADAQSAEAVKLGGADMSNIIQRKRASLKRFEQDMWQRIIYINNNTPGTVRIPEDTQLVIDFKPDPLNFSSANEEVTFFQATISKDVNTVIDWIRSRNCELSEAEALEKYLANKEFNSTIGRQVNPGLLVEPASSSQDEPSSDQNQEDTNNDISTNRMETI